MVSCERFQSVQAPAATLAGDILAQSAFPVLQPLKVAILIPGGGSWQADFCLSLAGLVQYAGQHSAPDGRVIDLKIFNCRVSMLPLSRNMLFREAINWGSEFVLTLDNDMKFPPDSLHRLLAHGADCVAADYSRRMTNDPVPRTLDAPPPNPPDTCTPLQAFVRRYVFCGKMRALEETRMVGFGLMLIKTAVLLAVPPPWAHFGNTCDVGGSPDTTWAQRIEHSMLQVMYEDRFFCNQLRTHGFKVLVDTLLSRETIHVGAAWFYGDHISAIPKLHCT